jgi:hypothetical protein
LNNSHDPIKVTKESKGAKLWAITEDEWWLIQEEVFWHNSDYKDLEQQMFFAQRTKLAVQRMYSKRNKIMAMLDASQWNLEDSYEPEALPENSEVEVRVTTVQRGTDKNGMDYIMVYFEVPSEPFSKEVSDFFSIPDNEKMDAKRLNQAKRKLLNFMECVGIDPNSTFDPEEEWPGYTGWAILSLRKTEQYGDQNNVRRYLIQK